jgi:hypothetical protein
MKLPPMTASERHLSGAGLTFFMVIVTIMIATDLSGLRIIAAILFGLGAVIAIEYFRIWMEKSAVPSAQATQSFAELEGPGNLSA